MLVTPEDFQPTAPGRVVRAVQGHWMFLPDPLPPTFTPNWTTVQRMTEAERALGELAGVGQQLPNPHLLIRPFISREAVLSSRIEGTQTRLDQLLLFEAEPEELRHPGDAQEVLNYVRATDFGLAQIRAGYPLNLGLIREVHRVLLDGVRGGEKRPGEVRDRGVLIGRAGQTYETARFVPPCHTALAPLLDDLVRFLREGRGLPVLAQLALAHYQFETIHPFNDGHGRVGRLLLTLMLCERGVLPEPLLSLSAFFEANRGEYYDGLLDVSRRGAWNDWLTYFAYGVAVQARDAATRARRLIALRQSYLHRAAEAVRAKAALRLVDELFASPFLTLRRATEVTGVAPKSAQNTIEKLVAAGLLREITGKLRNRVYCADEILKLLDQPLAEEPAAGRWRGARTGRYTDGSSMQEGPCRSPARRP
jgi:Fic family protein